MPKRIVFTRHDGGVSVCAPSLTAMRFMTCGGGRWGIPARGFLDRQIAEQAKYGVGERAAHRFVMALHEGGCSMAEAYDVMRDRFCAARGTGCELWGVSDVPRDRWFRDAWTRSHNGGPISIDMKRARPIQFGKIRLAVEAENKRRATDLERFDDPLELDWAQVRDAIRRVGDERVLRRVWPSALDDLEPTMAQAAN